LAKQALTIHASGKDEALATTMLAAFVVLVVALVALLLFQINPGFRA